MDSKQPEPLAFNSPSENSDLILRCQDGVDLYTNRQILAAASDVIFDMLKIARGDPNQKHVDVEESSLEWDRLLRWLDIRHVPLDDDLDDLSIIIQAVKKYLMDSVRQRILRYLNIKLQASPSDCFRLWAMAVRLRDQPLAAAAARVSIRFPLSTRTASMDYECIDLSTGIKLDQYRENVRFNVSNIPRVFNYGRTPLHLLAFWLNGLTLPPPFLGSEYPDVEGFDYNAHDPSVCAWKPAPSPRDADDEPDFDYTPYRAWFWRYLEILPGELEKCPSRETIAGAPPFAQEPLAIASQCGICQQTAYTKLIKFNAGLGKIIETTIDGIKMPVFTEEL